MAYLFITGMTLKSVMNFVQILNSASEMRYNHFRTLSFVYSSIVSFILGRKNIFSAILNRLYAVFLPSTAAFTLCNIFSPT